MKKFLVVLSLLVVILSFAAKVELVFWTHEDPNRTPLEEGYIKEFQKMYPNVEIKRVTYPSDKIKEVLLTAFAARKGPDIFNIEIQDEYPYIVNGRVAPVDLSVLGLKTYNDLKNQYLEGSLDAVTYKGKIYGCHLN